MFGRKKQPKPDYLHIAQLERELGLDDESVVAKKQRRLSRPVILEPKMVPLDALELRPRFKWPVSDHDDIRSISYPQVCASAYSGPIYRSRVVLPPGAKK